jgi:hypothetical protein
MGMTRAEMKKMLREVVQQALAKMVKVGAANWSAKNCVLWVISTALLRMSQGVCTTQAQAALNILGLKEFHCTRDDKKIVTLFSPPFVDYLKNKGSAKQLRWWQITSIVERSWRDTVLGRWLWNSGKK